jgi:DNA-binding SARP family transcriptional activator
MAGGGFGKTTALRRLAAAAPSCWLGLRPVDREIELLASRVAEVLGLDLRAGLANPRAAFGAEDRQALAETQAAILSDALARRGEPVLLVLDDLERLGEDSAAWHLLRALVLQAPSSLHLVLSGRRLPELGLGAAGSSEVLEITAVDLAFTLEETSRLLNERLGADDRELAERCRSLTGGWAAALAVIVDRLARVEPDGRADLLAGVPTRGSRLWREFVADLVEQEPVEERRTLELAAVVPMLHPGLLSALGIGEPEATLDGLASRGLLVDDGRAISPVLAEGVHRSLSAEESALLRASAARWLESEGRLGEALECCFGGPAGETRALLERCGSALIARGYGARVAEILRVVGSEESPALEAVLGEALQSVGAWDGAITVFARLRGQGDGMLTPAVAWRFGALLYFRGDSASALEVLTAAYTEGEQPTVDGALVSAWLSSTLWSRGEPVRAGELAGVALGQAERLGDPAALAAAHVTCALAAASVGDRERNERHYRAAFLAATEAGDSIQLARIHANLSSRAVEEGDYRRAIEEADAALTAGAGHRFFAALALCNKAEALLRLGELEDARASLSESVEIYESLGSLLAAAPHTMLGELYRERGDLARARISFERARRLAEAAHDAHTLVWAGCGLARTVALDDPQLARQYAVDAIERASSLERAHALSAAAWVELTTGERDAAGRLARDAEREARATGDRPAVVDALIVQGLAARPADTDRLRTAAELSEELGNPIAQQRALLAIAQIKGDGTAVAGAREELTTLGVATEPVPARAAVAELAIATLGRFAVLRSGESVPAAAWQSRKSRELLKLLVARRGRPLTRDAVAEALWPGEPPGPLSNRLSVALSTVRKVIDPERRYDPDHYIAADGQALALRLDHVEIDVVQFLRLADEALASGSEDMLRDAEHLYAGEFLEEDLYADWAVDCREAARATALEVSRTLAQNAFARGNPEEASRHLRRVLEHDPYDEQAWLGLVAAHQRMRRHGEARRQHAMYTRKMAELGVGAVPLTQADMHA